MTAPAYLPALVLGMSILMTVATLTGLNRALLRTAWPDRRRTWVLRIAAAVLIGWFAATLALALVGAFEGVPGRVPTIQYGFLVPVAVAAVLLWRSQTVRQIVDAVPQHWLMIDIYPLVLIPVFLVPLWTILASLMKLRSAA